jgi:hypothetical protein
MDDAKQSMEHGTAESNKCSNYAFSIAAKEKGAMSELKTGIVSYLFSQQGILPHLLRQYPLLGTRIATWAIGEKPVLIIGGEPGNGKSLLMGELVLRYNEMALRYHTIPLPLTLISYDQIHYLFLKRLSMINTSHPQQFLPEGETHPEARTLITEIMWHILLFALQHRLQNAPIILETPLIDHRGEDLISKITALNFQMQIFIMHSPAMRMRSLYDEKRRTEISAHPLAMQQIHEVLLQQRGVMTYSKEAQDDALAKSWEQWLDHCDGMVLSWNPAYDEEGFLYTKRLLEAMNIRTDPLSPALLEKYTLCVIEMALKMIPNLEAFARNVQIYGYG